MTDVRALLAEIRPRETDNPLLAAVADSPAPVAALAGEERLIIPSDRRSFLLLAARAGTPEAVEFFTGLAAAETLVEPLLGPLAEAAGLDDLTAYEPRAGCQAYASHVSWLALHADPAAAALALTANFGAWGRYCAELAALLRERHDFPDEACAFLDFFATPAPEIEERAVRAAEAGGDLRDVRRHARLLHDYETMFWQTLATAPPA